MFQTRARVLDPKTSSRGLCRQMSHGTLSGNTAVSTEGAVKSGRPNRSHLEASSV